MNKTRNNELIKLADSALRLQANGELYDGVSKLLNLSRGEIEDAYNGAIAALSVSVAMSDLRPTLAFYFQDKKSDSRPKANKRSILDVIGRMISNDANASDQQKREISYNGKYAENLFRYALDNDDPKLKEEIVDCAIALKQVVRTYKLV